MSVSPDDEPRGALGAILRPELERLHAYETPAAPARIRLDANESPWPLPEHARARMAAELGAIDLHRYPDPRAMELRAAIARHANAKPEELVLGVGSDEAISILETVLARPRAGSDRASVLLPSPSFSMYGIIARGHGLDAIEVPLDATFQLDVAAMKAAIDARRPNLIFLATPNNPTGNAFDEEAIRAIVRHARESLVVIDEAYVAYSQRGSLGHLFDEYENVAMLGTLSKIGLAALRVGWVRARPWLAGELEKVRLTYNLPTPSQRAATLALGELWPTLREQIARVVEERAALIDALARLPGLSPLPTDANFVLVRCDDHALAARLARGAYERGIQLRSFGAHPRLGDHLRITIGTPDENALALAALRETLAG